MTLTVATNLTDLHREPSFLAEMLCQIFNGMTMELLEEQEKWCRVRLEDGYEGWAYRGYLSDANAPTATHMVCSTEAPFFPEPTMDGSPLGRLLAGTALRISDVQDEWTKIQPAGDQLRAGWVQSRSLQSLTPDSAADARCKIVQRARRVTGVYYLWGGNTCFGTDCSGLSWLTHRLSGIAIPRDAHPQFHSEKGRVVEPPFHPGDLLFFRADSDPNRIGHVGISTGGWQMIHSSRSRNGVYEEDVQESEGLRRTFAGARSFLGSGT